MERILEWPRPNPDAPFLDELKAIIARVVELMDPTLLGIQLRLVADAPRYPQLFAAYQDKVMTKAAKRLTTLLERAIADGELPGHVDCRWAGDALVGVVFFRSIGSPGERPLSASAQSRIISAFFKTIGAPRDDLTPSGRRR
jgi:hypothetical protein